MATKRQDTLPRCACPALPIALFLANAESDRMLLRILVWQLHETAPNAAAHARRFHYNDIQPRRHELGGQTPCADASDWAAMMLETQASGAALNPHFMPQSETCRLGTVGYHHIIPLESPDKGLRFLAAALRVAYTPMPQLYRTRKNLQPNVSRVARPSLETVYAEDTRLLRYGARPGRIHWFE